MVRGKPRHGFDFDITLTWECSFEDDEEGVDPVRGTVRARGGRDTVDDDEVGTVAVENRKTERRAKEDAAYGALRRDSASRERVSRRSTGSSWRAPRGADPRSRGAESRRKSILTRARGHDEPRLIFTTSATALPSHKCASLIRTITMGFYARALASRVASRSTRFAHLGSRRLAATRLDPRSPLRALRVRPVNTMRHSRQSISISRTI